MSTKGLEEASAVTGVTEFRLPEGSILTSIRWVLTPREPWRHFWLSLSLAACTCHSCHLGSSPGTDNSGTEPACKDTSAGELLLREHTVSPPQWKVFSCWSDAAGQEPQPGPCPAQSWPEALLPPLLRHCFLQGERELSQTGIFFPSWWVRLGKKDQEPSQKCSCYGHSLP